MLAMGRHAGVRVGDGRRSTGVTWRCQWLAQQVVRGEVCPRAPLAQLAEQLTLNQ